MASNSFYRSSPAEEFPPLSQTVLNTNCGLCEILASRRSVAEVFALLRCYAEFVGSCLPTFCDYLLVPDSLTA
jgi:hypothetical protein